jgi:CheY-like chemotaxis protein
MDTHDERDRLLPAIPMRRILIAASDRRERVALRALLEADGRYVVVAEALTGPQAQALVKTLRPALILLDLLFPTAADGLDAVRQLARRESRPIVVLSALAGLHDAALEAGAAAFLEQGVEADVVLATIDAAMSRRAADQT